MILSVFMIIKRISNRLLKMHLKRIKKCVTKNKVKSLNMSQTVTLLKKTESKVIKWSTKQVSVKQPWMPSNSNNQSKQRKNKRARISSIHKVSKVPRTCLSKLLTKSNRFSQFNKGKPCFCWDFKTTWWTNTEVTLLAKVSFFCFLFTNFVFYFRSCSRPYYSID